MVFPLLFVELTDLYDNKKVEVALHNIVQMKRLHDDTSDTELRFTDGHATHVKETPAEIKAKAQEMWRAIR